MQVVQALLEVKVLHLDTQVVLDTQAVLDLLEVKAQHLDTQVVLDLLEVKVPGLQEVKELLDLMDQ
jgi:hypothetical protein